MSVRMCERVNELNLTFRETDWLLLDVGDKNAGLFDSKSLQRNWVNPSEANTTLHAPPRPALPHTRLSVRVLSESGTCSPGSGPTSVHTHREPPAL